MQAYPVTSLCGLLGVSKQAYYQHGNTSLRKLAEESFCVEYIKRIRAKDHGIGGGKLWLMYSKEFGKEHSVGYNRFYDIVEKSGLKVRKKSRRVRTTDSNHDYPTYPDLTRQLIPTAVNQLWASDITYMPYWVSAEDGEYDFCYLSLITDCYNKEIIGYSIGSTLEARYPMEALDMALSRVGNIDALAPSLIHHSDRGVQYASYGYTSRLKEHNIRISMTETGDPKDNAIAERVNNTIKNELLKDMQFYSMNEIKTAVELAINFYNNERPHMSLDGMTPAEARMLTGEIKKRWVSYREKAIKEAATGKILPNFVVPQ